MPAYEMLICDCRSDVCSSDLRCWPPTSTPRPTPAPASAEGLLLEAVGDATSLEVVGGDLDLDPITGEDPDAVLAHLPTQVPGHLVASIDRDPEVATLEGLFGGTFEQIGRAHV